MRTFNVLFLLASLFLLSGTAKAQDIPNNVFLPPFASAEQNDDVIVVSWGGRLNGGQWPIVYDVQLQLNSVLQPQVRVSAAPPSDPSDPQPMSMASDVP